MPQCCVNSCENRKNLHKFPLDETRRMLWTQSLHLQNDFTANRFVCENHFETSDFITEGVQTGLINRETFLKPNAVPFLVKPFEEIFIKEEPLEEPSVDSELNKKILQSVKKEECISNNDEQIDKGCDNPIIINNDIRKSENTNSKGFCCEICNKNFTWKSNLTKHIKIHIGIKNFECSTCNKLFLNKSYLIKHEKIHSGIKNYTCAICNRKFTNKSALNRHNNIHTGIRAHKCPICNKSFALNSNLKGHMKSHDEIKDHKCEICNKQFKYKSVLLQHLKIHIGIKAYQCPTCNKSFTQNPQLYSHMKIHSETKEYKCEICNKLFIRSQNLSSHMKYIHSGTREEQQ